MKPTNAGHRESGTITDVCNSEDLPEVELVSLLEDQLPQYQLRADSLYLYQRQDWIQTPAYPNNASTPHTPVLAEEAFRRMVLGTDGMDHMTKTSSDVDIPHVLAEKDRDLELAARIGQALLKRSHVLTERNEALEEQLAYACDRINQLQHELSKKDELLRIVFSASEESESDSSCSTPLHRTESFNASQVLIQLDTLQNKLKHLEEENLNLRSEACNLKTETISYEEKEQQLINECVKELRDSNTQITFLTEELSRKHEEIVRHQEEISTLLSQIVDLQHKVKECAIEKEELKHHLQASKEAQRQLTAELHDLQDLNTECVGMLHESQEEIKKLRNRSTPSTTLRRPQSYGLFPMDSLAAEIEGTIRREKSLEEDDHFQDQKKQQKRVFDTVKIANESARSRSVSAPPPLHIPGSHHSSVIMTAQPFQYSFQGTEEKATLSDRASDHPTQEPARLGQPGTPGGNDLAVALHRLVLRRDNYLSERQFFEEERERKLQALAAREKEEEGSSCSTPTGSIVSTGTSRSDLTDLSGSSGGFRAFMPDKLQIVKPMEGSLTLYQWQQLAQPNLNNILDPRPGVLTKGFRMLPDDTVYHLSDLEEEEEEGITFQVRNTSTPVERKPSMPKPAVDIFHPQNLNAPTPAPPSAANPGKCLSFTNSTFTFTTCRILHPSDITQVTPSSVYTPVPKGGNTAGPIMSSMISPVVPCYPNLGQSLTNRRDCTTTLSTTSNLATLLQERGISAKLYSSPVVQKLPGPRPRKTLPIPSTPPNSPSQSPCPSPVPFDPRGAPTENFLASRPAEALLQEKYALKPESNNFDLSQQKMSLVERLKRLGIAKVIKPQGVGVSGNSQGSQDDLLPPNSSALFIGNGSILMGGLRRNKSLPMIVGMGPQSGTSTVALNALKEQC